MNHQLVDTGHRLQIWKMSETTEIIKAPEPPEPLAAEETEKVTEPLAEEEEEEEEEEEASAEAAAA